MRLCLLEQDKYICLNQEKTEQFATNNCFCVWAPHKTWTVIKAEKKSYDSDKGETNILLEISKLFHQVILLLSLGQAINLCLYIRCFNLLISFVGDKKRADSILKNNATESENMLFEPKYEELVVKSLSAKNRSKELFGSIKNQGSSKEGKRRQPFQKRPLLRTRGNRGRGMFHSCWSNLATTIPYRRTTKG